MKVLILPLLMASVCNLLAQSNLLDELEEQKAPAYVLATFKGTRIVNGHSVETRPGGTLEFSIMHRFGLLSSGGYNLWGLDYSTIRLGLEYGITDRLGISIGRSSFDKSFDSYIKYKVLRQANEGFPLTMTALGSMAYNSSAPKVSEGVSPSDALAYAAQLLIARKVSPGFSLQLAPSVVHRNMVDQDTEVNTLFALGMATRMALTRSFSINAEYYMRLNEHPDNTNFNSLGLSFEFETGGHVFQLIFTNSLGMMERRLIAETTDDFFNGDIHFGFNITRTFQLHRKK